jgi:hypothetical protein
MYLREREKDRLEYTALFKILCLKKRRTKTETKIEGATKPRK